MTNPQDLLTPPGSKAEMPKEVPDQPTVLTLDTVGGLQVTKPASEGYVNMLIFGEPGAGKTRLAGSAVVVPEMAPVLLLDFEGGTLSLAGDYHDVEVVRAKDWRAVDKMHTQLMQKNPYKTVVLDSLTECQKFLMSEIMKEVIKKDSSRDPDIASLREWGKQGEVLRRLIRALRDLPCNTIFTALEHQERNDSGKVTKTRPALPGQLKGEIAGYVDIVGYLYKKEFRVAGIPSNKSLMLTLGTETIVAKDRSGTLPVTMEDPTMKQIHEYITGQRKEDK